MKGLSLLCTVFLALLASASDPPAVHVDPIDGVGPRQLEKLTETSVVRDYLESWRALDDAMGGNRPSALDAYFIGIAKEKLESTVAAQQNLGIKSRYQDRVHDVRLVFYSPEGLSIQLLDTVEYDVQIIDHGDAQPVQHLRATYVAVLTPGETRWKVRILQAEPSR